MQECERKETVGYSAFPDVPWAAMYGLESNQRTKTTSNVVFTILTEHLLEEAHAFSCFFVGSPLFPNLGDKIVVCAYRRTFYGSPLLTVQLDHGQMFINEKKGFSPPILFPTFWRNFLFSLSTYHPLREKL
jgi:hypothetical protein